MSLVCRGSGVCSCIPHGMVGGKISDEPATDPPVSKPASALIFGRASHGYALYRASDPWPSRRGALLGRARHVRDPPGRTVVVTDGESPKNNGPAAPSRRGFRLPADGSITLPRAAGDSCLHAVFQAKGEKICALRRAAARQVTAHQFPG
jgi:hypothetical protein